MTRSPGLGRTVPGRSIRLMPLQRLREIAAGIFDVQHPAVPATLRTTGRVQPQGSHNQRATNRDITYHFRAFPAKAGQF